MKGRRWFLGMLGGAAAALLVWPWRSVQAKKVAISLEKAKDLKKVGASVTLKVRGRSILFVRDTEKTVKALDPICTHARCTVAWKKSEGLRCPCHRSLFALDGKVLDGPAPKPLKTYPATLSGDRIILSLDE